MKTKVTLPGVIFEITMIFILIFIDKLETYKKDKEHKIEIFILQVRTRANKRSGSYAALKEYAKSEDFDIEILKRCIKN